MKVLLLKFVPKVGSQGDVVDVADGYAKNALIAKKLATPATPAHIRAWEEKKTRESALTQERKKAIHNTLPILQKHLFTFTVKTGEGNAVFTSVHQDEIKKTVGEFLHEKNKIFTEEDVHIDIKPIKELGEQKISIRIGRGENIMKTEITLEITGE